MSALGGVAQTEAARLLVESLADAGLRDVVVSPGSRSTPLVVALARCSRLALFDVIDERSAAYFALGRVRRTGRPALLVTTSGTAGAHAYPAVLEAEATGLPLVVMTADRPLELQGCGALQTLDQRDLFGRHVRAAFEIALSEGGSGIFRALRRTAAQIVASARGPVPGPVHVNVKAKKPLEPAEPTDDAGGALVEEARRVAATPLVRIVEADPVPPRPLVEELAARVIEEEHGLMVCGPLPPGLDAAPIFELARRASWPLLAEATSQLRYTPAPAGVLRVPAFDAILRARRASARFIFQLGAFPTSGGFEPFLLAESHAHRMVAAPFGYPDPVSSAAVVAQVEPAALARAVVAVLEARGFSRRPGAFFEAWSSAAEHARREAAAEIARGEGLTEAAVTDLVVASLPRGATLAVGNGLPIRHLDLFGLREAELEVLAQRGTSGIDGLISSAAGLAADPGTRPTLLLLGDVSALHDLTGLAAAARHVRAPLVIVVLHNDGGRIFEQLPIARTADPATLAHFLTPHATRFDQAAAAFSVPHVAPKTRAALQAALAEAVARPGVTLIETQVPPHDAQEAYARMFAAVRRALGGEP